MKFEHEYTTQAERDAHEDGRHQGQWEAMREAANCGTLNCAVCGAPATCIGAYEASTPVLPACDDCCGHGCEDGHCEPIGGEK